MLTHIFPCAMHGDHPTIKHAPRLHLESEGKEKLNRQKDGNKTNIQTQPTDDSFAVQ